MEINKHISFKAEKASRFIQYLEENEIPFEKGELVCCLDIHESSSYWKAIKQYVEEERLLCISNMIFSEEELEGAEWLTIRSQWRNGYPQPENNFQYKMITYTRENYCQECGCGLKQVNAFRFKQTPKWGKRHFMMLNWIEDELFVDETVKESFQKEGFSGISFHEVMNKKGDAVYPNVYQLVMNHQLKEGCVKEQSGLRETSVCPACGVKKYHPNGAGTLAFRKEIFENAPDIVKTSEYFGWGKSAAHEIIVRQNVYQMLINNRLERGLIFEPIELLG